MMQHTATPWKAIELKLPVKSLNVALAAEALFAKDADRYKDINDDLVDALQDIKRAFIEKGMVNHNETYRIACAALAKAGAA